MLSSIFPDAPHEQQQDEGQETPGSYFAEFLPEGFSQRLAPSHPPSAFASEAAQQQPAAAPAGAATPTASATSRQQPQRKQQQPADAGNTSTQQQQQQQQQQGGDDGASTNSDWFDFDLPDLPDFDLPSAGDVTQRISRALFGDGDPATDDGVLEKILLPFYASSGAGLPGWRRRPPKPLRLKIAEQVLSKQVLSAVQLIDEQILSAPDPLPNATIKFFLKAADGMGRGWARRHAGRVCAAAGAYVAVSCGLFHAGKVAAKWLVRRLPRRLGGREGVAVHAVDFAADILLPSSFFGPLLVTYVLVKLVARQQAKQQHEVDAAVQTGEPPAAAAGDGPGAAAATPGTTVKRQQTLKQRSRSREVQLQLCVQPSMPAPPPALLRRRTALGRSGSLRTRAWRRLSGTTTTGPAGQQAAVLQATASALDMAS